MAFARFFDVAGLQRSHLAGERFVIILRQSVLHQVLDRLSHGIHRFA